MNPLSGRRSRVGILIAAAAILAGPAAARAVPLAAKGAANCVIVAPAGSLTWEGDSKAMDRWSRIAGLSGLQVEAEVRRRLQRDSIKDLALYLGKLADTRIEIVEGLPAGDKRIPIYVGAAAEKVFGPVGIDKAGKFGFRVVADGKKGVGLYGQSAYGTSYAVYELLHRLGCRWFMPGVLGECLPSPAALAVPELDAKLAPATEWRRMEGRTADEDFRRRNRLGLTVADSSVVNANHALPLTLKWWREDAATGVADGIIARLDQSYSSSVSLSPNDGVMPTEDPEGRKYDPEPRVWEPAANQWSTTDRMMLLCNRVAERVGKKYPDVLFGVLAYVNFSQPPAREPVHPNVIPVIAPIDFNRHHPMNWPDHPNKTWLLDMVRGWGKKASRIGYYAYGMNLAELSAPCPFITKWGTDIPIILSNNCAFWMPETMGGWESMLPGFYLSIRMTFYREETPEAVLADLWPRFYGAAAEPMARYWQRIDQAWIGANEYSGCLFGYLRMFTPDVLQGARADLDEALKRAGKPDSLEYRRVKLIDLSLAAFERFMKMRQDWAAGRLADLDTHYEDWKGAVNAIKAFAPDGFVVGGLTFNYTDSFIGAAYRDGARVDRELTRLGPALLEWKWKHNPGPEADSLPWTRPDYDDKEWKTTHGVRETWSTIGHHNTMTSGDRSGRMAYRASVNLADLPAGRKAYVWIGSTDGSARLFVNGTPVKYVVPEKTRWNEKGDALEAFSGYCQPAQFEVTAAVKPGPNQLTLLCERKWLNEIGTGGLMGPVIVCREK